MSFTWPTLYKKKKMGVNKRINFSKGQNKSNLVSISCQKKYLNTKILEKARKGYFDNFFSHLNNKICDLPSQCYMNFVI